MPLHQWHIDMIEFAASKAHQLIILVCTKINEPIEGQLRYKRVKEYFKDRTGIKVIHFDCTSMPDSAESDRWVSQARAEFIKNTFPEVDLFVASEKYGEYVAEYACIDHLIYDIDRTKRPISATMIRNDPFICREFIPNNIKPYFSKKIFILWSESTGKSTLTQKLAEHYNTIFVPEMARFIVEKTENVTLGDLKKILNLHSFQINQVIPFAKKLLFIDTNSSTTKSYSKYLFGKELKTNEEIEQTNRWDLYLYLEPTCEYIQDGTRLEIDQREALNQSHKKQLKEDWITYHTIAEKSRDERTEHAKQIIDSIYKKNLP